MNLSDLLELRESLVGLAKDENIDDVDGFINRAFLCFEIAHWREYDADNLFRLTHAALEYALEGVAFYIQQCAINKQNAGLSDDWQYRR